MENKKDNIFITGFYYFGCTALIIASFSLVVLFIVDVNQLARDTFQVSNDLKEINQSLDETKEELKTNAEDLEALAKKLDGLTEDQLIRLRNALEQIRNK